MLFVFVGGPVSGVPAEHRRPGRRRDHHEPVQIGIATWKGVSAGNAQTCAIGSNDTLWCWGLNLYGQVGDGTTTNRTSPVEIGTATWRSVSTGDSHTCGIRFGSTLWCWGLNTSGQVGDGTTSQRTSPVQIGSLTSWGVVDAGGSHTHGLLNG